MINEGTSSFGIPCSLFEIQLCTRLPGSAQLSLRRTLVRSVRYSANETVKRCSLYMRKMA